MKFIIFIFLFGFETFGQKADSTTFSSFLNITFGNKFINRKGSNANGKIEYFDYILQNDNLQIGVQMRNKLKKRNAITYSILLYNDLELRNFEIMYSKLKLKKFGYFTSFKTYGHYFSLYPLANKVSEFQNFTIHYSNEKYGYVNQPSINIGPLFYFKNSRFTIESKLNFSLGYLGKFYASDILVSNNSFEIVKIDVISKKSPYFSIIPDLSVSFFPLHFKNSKIGLIAYGNYQNVKRSFNYERKITRWTSIDFEKENITGNKQQFKNLEINFGLNWQFK